MKRSHSSYLSHQILIRGLQSNFPMEKLLSKKIARIRGTFPQQFFHWEMALQITVQNLMCGMRRVPSFQQ